LRKRFHPELNNHDAAAFMKGAIMDAYDKWTTRGYDIIQYLQQGITH
jgi:phosphatidylinositol 4-kinase